MESHSFLTQTTSATSTLARNLSVISLAPKIIMFINLLSSNEACRGIGIGLKLLESYLQPKPHLLNITKNEDKVLLDLKSYSFNVRQR